MCRCSADTRPCTVRVQVRTVRLESGEAGRPGPVVTAASPARVRGQACRAGHGMRWACRSWRRQARSSSRGRSMPVPRARHPGQCQHDGCVLMVLMSLRVLRRARRACCADMSCCADPLVAANAIAGNGSKVTTANSAAPTKRSHSVLWRLVCTISNVAQFRLGFRNTMVQNSTFLDRRDGHRYTAPHDCDWHPGSRPVAVPAPRRRWFAVVADRILCRLKTLSAALSFRHSPR